MKQVCKFDKARDITEVVPGLGVNIREAMNTGSIKDTSVPAMFNMQKDIAEVGSRLSEPFDVIEYDRAYTRIRKSINDKAKEDDE